ncbi:MAG: hypothetical protein QOF37_1156 [Thermoleophilaceae bacterium]|nr:hypothetical protein [Thermoleophilaceae bacterium]
MKKLALLVTTAAAIFGAPAAQAANNVTVGHSGWFWGNPQPQGNTLSTIDYAGGAGYAAGDFGTLLKTQNSGLSWSGIPTGVTVNVQRVRVLDAATLFVGGGCLLRRSTDGGTTFSRVPFTPSERSCTSPLASFSFVNANTGYILLANGTVIRTDDAGQNIALKTAVPGTAASSAPANPPALSKDIYFTSTETGFATAGSQIFRTTDGGNTWEPVGPAAAAPLNSLYFASANVGYAVGNAKTVMKTMDGGATWGPKPVPAALPAADLTQIRCAAGSVTLCLLSSAQGDQLLRTTDGGDSFSSVVPSSSKVFAAAFDGSAAATGVGAGGVTVVSGDAGEHWTPVQGGLPLSSLTRLRATSATLITAPGANGTLARTLNGGQDWSKVGVPSPTSVKDVSFSSASDGFAVDTSGTLFHTTIGGSGWQTIDAGGAPNPNPSAIFSPDSSTVMFVGPKGVSTGRGGGNDYTFTGTANKQIAKATLTGYDRAGKTVFVWGPRALFSTAGSGTAIPRPGGRRALMVKADFITPKTGYVLNRDGRVWATGNAGKRWRELVATGTGQGYDMAWGDVNSGWISIRGFGSVQSGGYVLRTSDGGKSWRPQLVSPAPVAAGGLVAPGPATGLLLSQSSALFYTTSGGDLGTPTALTITTNVKRLGKRGANVKVSGRLSPAVGNADVFVFVRQLHANGWRVVQPKPTSSAGTFTQTVRIRQPSYVVAQWAGDGDHNGDGSNVITLKR